MVHSMANNMSYKLSHTMIRGRTYYTNFRLNDSTSFVRLSLGTDSRKQAEVIMNQIRPFIPLVQNGAMSLEEFKHKMQGYRAATKQDFDEYLLNWLRGSDLSRLSVAIHTAKVSMRLTVSKISRDGPGLPNVTKRSST